MAYLDNTGVGTLWGRIKTYISGLGYTTNTGTITGITMNGASKGTSGVVDLGSVVTDVSGKANTADLATVATSGSYTDLDDKPTIPTVPSNIVTGLNSAGVATAYTIKVVDSLPGTTDSSTIYLVTGS